MDSRDQRIAELQSQLAMLEEARQEDRRSMTQHLRELQQQLRGKDESLRNTTAEARHWEDQANQLYNSMVTEQTRNNDQIRQLEERCATSTSKLEQKDSELNSVKALLSTRNESSDAEIVKGLDHVNNLIEEMTRQYSHHFLSLPVKGMPVKSADPVPSLFHEALGDDLLQLMDAIPTGGSFAPFVLQIAWQGILGRATWWAMEMFQITHWNGPPKYHLMNKLGAEIESSESQPMYGHWRAITNQALRNITTQDTQMKSLDALVARAISCCHHALELLLKHAYPSLEQLSAAFRGPVREIFLEAIKLARIIREDVISKNYRTIALDPETKFDPRTMSLEDESDSVASDDRVVCTTRLGLFYSYKQGNVNTGAPEHVLLCKTQVIPTSLLDQLREPESHNEVKDEVAEEEMVRRAVRLRDEIPVEDW